MSKSTIIGFHFPHKTISMFAYKILKEVSMRYGIPLFLHNNKLANHSDVSIIQGSDAIVYGGREKSLLQKSSQRMQAQLTGLLRQKWVSFQIPPGFFGFLWSRNQLSMVYSGFQKNTNFKVRLSSY